MKHVLLAAFLIAFSSCATTQAPREPSKLVLQTKKKPQDALTAAAKALMSAGYRTKTIDRELGMLNTEPKEFSVPRGLLRIDDQARSSVQLLAVPQGLEVQVVHECRYTGINYATGVSHNLGFSVCTAGDVDANEVVPAQDQMIEKIIADSLAAK